MHLQSLRLFFPRLRALFLDKHAHVSTSMHANTNTLSHKHNQLDATAMDAECAEEAYVWLYVFIVLVVPTIVGVLCGAMAERMHTVATTEGRERTTRIA
jgi:hypothetical protein